MASNKSQGATQAKLICRWPDGKFKAQPCIGWGMAPNKELEKNAASQSPGTLPSDGRHHRRQAKRHAVSRPLRLALEPLAVPLSRLGQVFAVGYRSSISVPKYIQITRSQFIPPSIIPTSHQFPPLIQDGRRNPWFAPPIPSMSLVRHEASSCSACPCSACPCSACPSST